MRVKTHSIIAQAAYELVQQFLPQSFQTNVITLGSMAPDIVPHRRVRSHNANRALKEWELFLAFVNKKIYTSFSLSYAAGIMSHYISDTFCYAHNFLNVNLAKHRVYEVKLQEYIMEMNTEILTLKEVFKNWNVLQQVGLEHYLETERKTYTDLVQHIKDEEMLMRIDIQRSILNSAVWMMEIAYVVSPDLVRETSLQFA